jgi:hypothetical protein
MAHVLPAQTFRLNWVVGEIAPTLCTSNTCLIHFNKLLTFKAFTPKCFFISMQDRYIFLTQIEIGKGFNVEAINIYSFYKVTQNKYQRRWLQWNTDFTSEALNRSILIWQNIYMKIGQKDLLVSLRSCARSGRRVFRFYCFFIIWSILGLLKLFLSLNLLENSIG